MLSKLYLVRSGYSFSIWYNLSDALVPDLLTQRRKAYKQTIGEAGNLQLIFALDDVEHLVLVVL